MSNSLRQIIAALDKFWFRKQSTLTLGVFRIAFGCFYLSILLCSYPNWDRFYGANGVYPLSAFIQSHGGFMQAATASILAWSDANWFLWVVFGLGVLAAIAFILGFYTRLATILLFIIWISITHRNPAIITGADGVAMMLVFFSCFAPLGNSLSLDSRFKYRHHQSHSIRTIKAKRKSIWSWRLMQVSIAMIYLFAGPSKVLDDLAWADGSAIYYLSHDPRWFRFPQVNFLHNEIFSVYSTYGGILIQVLFPLMIWFKQTRVFVLISAVIFHISIGIVLNNSVLPFSVVMVSALMLFVQPSTFRKLINSLSKRYALMCQKLVWTRL